MVKSADVANASTLAWIHPHTNPPHNRPFGRLESFYAHYGWPGWLPSLASIASQFAQIRTNSR
jgi:hypothetical protein